MSSPQHNDGEGIITDINVTPLVDIMLVLLIIFMLTTHIIDKQAIEMQLPKAETGEAAPTTVLGLTLDQAGALYLNGETMSQTALQAHLVTIKQRDPDARALIAADARLAHGKVVALIDLLRQAGIEKFALNVEPAPPASFRP